MIRPDIDTCREFLRRIGHPVVISARKPIDQHGRTTIVWPHETDDVADTAYCMARDYHAIYCNLNPIRPDVFARFPACGVRGWMIARRTRLLIDIDAHNGESKEDARQQKDAIKESIGEPLIETDSGNGYGLIYPCDLPANHVSTEQVKEFLRQLKEQFPLVDLSVSSLSRLTRVAGSLNKSVIDGTRIPVRILND